VVRRIEVVKIGFELIIFILKAMLSQRRKCAGFFIYSFLFLAADFI